MPQRGIFGVSPYRKGGAEGSTFFTPPAPIPQPPKASFLQTSDRRGPQGEASITFTGQRPPNPVLAIKRYFETDIPVKPYYSLLAWIRGSVGDPPGVAIGLATVTQFLSTPPPLGGRVPEAGIIFPPNFLQYDPTGMGTFMTVSPPQRTQVWPYRFEALVVTPAVPGPLEPGELHQFKPQPLSYQSPWRQEGSSIKTPISASVFFSYEIQRFLTTPIAWKFTQGFQVDASVFRMPQGPNPIPLPASAHNIWPMVMRRKKLLGELW